MDRQLSAAVLSVFGDADADKQRADLRTFSNRRWIRSLYWLDASGLALYFLDRLRSLRIQDALPQSMLNQLKQRHTDNQQRTQAMLDEFSRINAAFACAQLQYANLKGFTLAPAYCTDLSLRYQMDCDFLVDKRDATRYSEILSELGYSLIAASHHVMEFKTDVGFTPGIGDLYKPRPQRSVELHFVDDKRSDRRSELLKHARLIQFGDCSYPALSAEDMFLAQASHIFRHVRSEWIRISWLLEFKQFIINRRHDADFWCSIRTLTDRDADSSLAVGVAIRFTERAFGELPTEPLARLALRQLPSSIALWLEHFAESVLCADFPGSKLYLILEQELGRNDGSPPKKHRLFPTRPPAPVVAAPSRGFGLRLRAMVSRSYYFSFRLRFHIFATSRYLLESWRWKRLLKYAIPTDKTYDRADCTANAAN